MHRLLLLLLLLLRLVLVEVVFGVVVVVVVGCLLGEDLSVSLRLLLVLFLLEW